MAALAAALLLALSATPAWAAPGGPGGYLPGNPGGAGGDGGGINPAQDGAIGGGAPGTAGVQGDSTDTSSTITTSIIGTNGGNSANVDAPLLSGGGGGGGGGLRVTADGVAILNSAGVSISGGTGGGGSGGGGGGDALAFRYGGSVVNDGFINGGKGGEAYGGNGGHGGTGVLFSEFGSIINNGTVIGGEGGLGGGFGGDAIEFQQGGSLLNTSTGVISGAIGSGTTGGVAVRGSNIGIVNAGAINAVNDSSVAIAFVSGTNSLELQQGWSVLGTVVGASGADDSNTLILGGDTTDLTSNPSGTSKSTVFDSAMIGNIPAQYRGFTAFQKTGASTWALTGSTDYVSPWTLSDGTLQVAADGSLGAAAGRLTLDGGILQTTQSFTTTRDMGITHRNGVIQIDADTTLVATGVIGDADVGSSGSLTKAGTGTLILAGANTYTGGTTIASGTLQIGDGGTTGSIEGEVVNDAALVFNRSDAVSADSAIHGSGTLLKEGSGTLTLGGANSYTGTTTVATGALQAGAVDVFSASSSFAIATGATLDLAGFSQTVAGLTTRGTVSLVGSAPGTVLTVTGPYVGDNGTLRLGAQLGDDGSASDRLVLSGSGASASGHTNLEIINFGGLGALTLGNGIEVITAENGATTTAQGAKDAFSLSGEHVDAGAYEYRLYAADAAGQGDNWYLRSTSTTPVPSDPGTPVTRTPGLPATPDLPAIPGLPTTPDVPVVTEQTPALPTYRAEVPLYTALPSVVRQADAAMLSTLHRRVGDDGPTDSAAAHRGWARVLGGNTEIEQGGTTSPKSDIDTWGIQAGVDVHVGSRWNTGLYVGQLRSDAQVDGLYGLNFLARAHAGRLRTDSTYLGGYSTYSNLRGQYADVVLQYGHHDVTATPAANRSADSSGNSLMASVEVGQRIAIGKAWAIEPQAQLIVNQQRLGNAEIGGGTVVEQDSATTVVGRLGVRVVGDLTLGTGQLQPYARLNLWHGFGGTDATTFNTAAAATTLSNGSGYTATEAAVGATWALGSNVSLYGEVGRLFATGSSEGVRLGAPVSGSVGMKLTF